MTTQTLSRPPKARAHGTTSSARRGKPSRSNIPRRSDLHGSDAGLDLTTLGGRLAWARLREDQTQDHLADAIEKVRATIVAYESNKIMPPIPIVERLARTLRVSPSFLAFGEHGVKTPATSNAAEDTVTLDEITYGRDGSYVSGAFAMPRAMAQTYVSEVRDLKVIVMSHHAPIFNLRAGDRVFVDTSVTEVTNTHDNYLIETAGGLEIIRTTLGVEKKAMITIEGPRGNKSEVRTKNLKVIGAMVGQISRH